ncbi:phytanoyl-CoA dioxygenase family protein [Pelagibius sp. Alg239-R121]|uniref:phytanoyl-CoA dioxygenase family protein n=1 Tax=Pelagibius sp. Alg239-R121 TaxID=2993448 RepID=UPI0024A6801E|nr:phytanoyl-CoA dioxygenase family protein [Pelagibius sp. Alg239-R121]
MAPTPASSLAGSLAPAAVDRYQRDGFLFPLNVFDAAETARHRAAIEALEARDDPALPRPLGQYFRVNAHYVLPLAVELALTPKILDIVGSILGPDLLVWSCEFFIKEAGTPKIVSWHQDLTYWGLGETDGEMTAWLALSPATPKSGCMRFVAGSHRKHIQPHKDTFNADNLLSRGQELAVAVDEADATDVVLEPGQMSLHHGRMFHASGPNHSDDRRIGVAIRYVTPAVRQIVGKRDYAMLARGMDRDRNWINVAPPGGNFEPAALARYETILADQTEALSAGAAQPVGLYAT